MPFRRAWLYVLALLILTFVAFWPGYFSQLPVKKVAHHYHAASAVLWMLLAIAQSWTIHHNRIALHRKLGLAIFVLFPFFMIAGMWVIHVEAATLAGDFTSLEGQQIAQFGFFDPLANIAFALLFYGGPQISLQGPAPCPLHARHPAVRDLSDRLPAARHADPVHADPTRIFPTPWRAATSSPSPSRSASIGRRPGMVGHS